MSELPYPVVRLLPGESRRLRAGHPWAYANELALDEAAKAIAPGSLVILAADDGSPLGIATFNGHSLITARIMTRTVQQPIDHDFLAERVAKALARRERFFDAPFYRLVHSEADDLPGLIVDRFGEVAVCQCNTAGMAALVEPIVAALDTVLAPGTVVLRNDSAARTLEGLTPEVRIAKGTLDGPVTIEENGVTYLADVLGGQKTGWFYDQCPARALVAGLARGRRVLDLYSYTGGFALQAAAHGAQEAVLVDGSGPALALAAEAAARNGIADRCATVESEVFGELTRRAQRGERFAIVIADPPAFVRSRKGLKSGLKGYRKLTRLAAQLVEPGGLLFLASCSHLVGPLDLAAEIRRGLAAAKRSGRILAAGGPGPDHPVHGFLPESAYLNWQLLELD